MEPERNQKGDARREGRERGTLVSEREETGKPYSARSALAPCLLTWQTNGNWPFFMWYPSSPRGKTAASASEQPTAVRLFRLGWEFWI